MTTRKKDIYDACNQKRQKAIAIMEYIAEYLGKPDIFDCKNGDTTWYDVEDTLTNIIARKK